MTFDQVLPYLKNGAWIGNKDWHSEFKMKIVDGHIKNQYGYGVMIGNKDLLSGSWFICNPEFEVSKAGIKQCLEYLVSIQYFPECANKHRAWAWDALNSLNPHLAELCSNDPSLAYSLVYDDVETSEDQGPDKTKHSTVAILE